MRILIDIGHPAHVHLFKNFAWEMKKRKHEIFFTCREKEFEVYLLNKYKFNYNSFGKKYQSKFGKFFGLIEFDVKEFFESIKFKPDILVSHGSIYAAHAAFFLRKPHISLEDSGNWEQIKLYLPFTSSVLTPEVLKENLGYKQIKYNGYHELAYLHNNWFKKNGAFKNNNSILIRFVSWKATHDYGQLGLSYDEKLEIINYLTKNYKIVISSESKIPFEFQKYKIMINPEEIHTFISNANLVISEGATVASEAGILGIPSIYVNSISRSYCEDLEKYGLVYNFRNGKGVLKKIKNILNTPNFLELWQKRRNIMLKEKIDVTSFLIWFVENYPKSFKEMKENPEYIQNYFKY